MRTLIALMLFTQIACSQVLIGVKAPKSTQTVTVPGVPVLVAPANLATGVAVSTTLSWNPVDSADTYTVNISTVSSFATTVVNWTTQYTSVAVYNLDSGTVYYWRVRASNLAGNSAWATYRQFTTVTGSAPGTPIISSPLAGADSVEIDPLLSWTAVAATSYKVQVSLSSSYLSYIVDTTLTATSLQMDTLSYNTKYYWRVRGTNSWGTGSYATASFTTTPLISRVRPGPITTLASYDTDTNKIMLRWVAVGNDSLTGRAASYDARRYAANITEANWSGTTLITGEPTPKIAGQYDSLTVSGLTANTPYYFAIKVSDDTTGVSALSNVVSVRTDTLPVTPLGPGYPNAIRSLVVDSTSKTAMYLSWLATGDDGSVGTATSYDIRYSTRYVPSTNLITNGGFNTDIAGWESVLGLGTPAWDAGGGRIDGGALKLPKTDNYSGVVFPIAHTSADSVTVSMWVKCTYKDTLDLYVLDESNSIVGGSSQKVIQAGTWTYITRTIKLSGTQTTIQPGFNFDPGVSGNTVWVDDASCTVGLGWDDLTTVTGEPTPHVAGTLEHYALSGLSEGTKYYVAIKAIDDSSHISEISNVASDTTLTTTIIYDSTGGKHVTADASGSGDGSFDDPWTITQMNASAAAGDTVYLHAGVYTTQIRPANAGTSGRPIWIRNYGTDVCSLYVANTVVYIDKNYIIVEGLRLQKVLGVNNYVINVLNNSHSALLNNYIYGGAFNNTHSDGDDPSVRLSNLFYFRMIGNYVDRQDASVTADDYRGDCIALYDYRSSYNIVEGNTVTNVSHCGIAVPYGSFTQASQYNIVRFNRTYSNHIGWGAADQHEHSLFEGNIAYFAGEPLTYRGGVSTEGHGHNAIYRYNQTYDDAPYHDGLITYEPGGNSPYLTQGYWAEFQDCRLYGNAWMGKCGTPRNRHSIFIQDGSNPVGSGDFGRNVWKNNTFTDPNPSTLAGNTDNGLSAPMAYQHEGGQSAFPDTLAGNLFWAQTPGDTIISYGWGLGVYYPKTLAYMKSILPDRWQSSNIEASPKFVDSVSTGHDRSFVTQASSPCVNGGVALTTVKTGVSGSKVVSVADAGYFHYDWGANPYDRGDSVLIGTSRCELDSVDYTNHRLILKSEITVGAGANVHVIATWRTQTSSYVRRLYGSAPDIGSYERPE